MGGVHGRVTQLKLANQLATTARIALNSTLGAVLKVNISETLARLPRSFLEVDIICQKAILHLWTLSSINFTHFCPTKVPMKSGHNCMLCYVELYLFFIVCTDAYSKCTQLVAIAMVNSGRSCVAGHCWSPFLHVGVIFCISDGLCMFLCGL